MVTNERVAADMRLVEVKGGCAFDTSAITGKRGAVAADTSSSKDYLSSPNMAFAGYFCTSGECLGVVVSTGANTLMGKAITKGQWPPKGYGNGDKAHQ